MRSDVIGIKQCCGRCGNRLIVGESFRMVIRPHEFVYQHARYCHRRTCVIDMAAYVRLLNDYDWPYEVFQGPFDLELVA